MAPKKKSRVSSPAPLKSEPQVAAQSAMPAADLPINKDYYQHVRNDIDTILSEWPTILTLDPLPFDGTTGFSDLTGYGTPFNPVVFDQHVHHQTSGD